MAVSVCKMEKTVHQAPVFHPFTTPMGILFSFLNS